MFEEKVYGQRVRRFTQKLESSLFDAYRRMEADRTAQGLRSPMPEHVKVWSWPQIWPDDAFGFGGEGRAGQFEAQAHVVHDDLTGTAYAYHDGRFVRRVERPTEAFWGQVRAHELPGAANEVDWSALTPPDPS
jgi:hypothetical protein